MEQSGATPHVLLQLQSVRKELEGTTPSVDLIEYVCPAQQEHEAELLAQYRDGRLATRWSNLVAVQECYQQTYPDEYRAYSELRRRLVQPIGDAREREQIRVKLFNHPYERLQRRQQIVMREIEWCWIHTYRRAGDGQEIP